MSLRGRPVEETTTLPDGRTATVRVAVPDDPYVAKKELDTVALELHVGDELVAALHTVLDPGQTSEALALAREVASKLGSGELEPTAGAIEPLALEPR